MTISITCCVCGSRQPIDAVLIEDDAKRLAAVLADMEPTLARAALGYLRLFKPAKTELRIARAAKILRALLDLVQQQSVCRDERSAQRRPATAAMWTAGIERMLASPPHGLPIDNHNYLRAIVYGFADASDAVAEAATDAALRTRRSAGAPGRPSPLADQLAWLGQMLNYGQITAEQHAAEAAAIKARHQPTAEGDAK